MIIYPYMKEDAVENAGLCYEKRNWIFTSPGFVKKVYMEERTIGATA
jgi:hypothetical protein